MLAWSRSPVVLGLALLACGSERAPTAPGGPGGTSDRQPVIVSFSATPAVVAPGGSTTLAWAVTHATSLSIDGGVGAVTGLVQKRLTPGTTTAYTLTATGAAGTTPATATATVTVQPAGTVDVTVAVDSTQDRRPISPYVYGYNAASAADAPAGTTWLRLGGNRWTAYNWTSNYSNAGLDWGPYSNDSYMGVPGDGPAHAIAPTIDDAKAHGLAVLTTIPIQGWVSKDRSGNVPLSSALGDHFVPNLPRKGSAFTLTPSSGSTTVYQDELANFIAQLWGLGATPHFSLDNEPDLWGFVDAKGAGHATHPEVQRTQATWAGFTVQTIASASAIKDAVPGGLVFGPASYGWQGYVDFQGAPDRPAGTSIDASFLDRYLTELRNASAAQRHRLLDVLDVHFYTEAQSHGCRDAADDGIRVNLSDPYDGQYAARNHDCVVAERVQSPRSLDDPTFVETSWITQWSTPGSSLGTPIQLGPRLLTKIAAGYPGTLLSASEYDFGGADHPSGAVAQADALGRFGRAGFFAAAFWPVLSDSSWADAAWRAYRNYDGAGHDFGDTSLAAATGDADHLSAYASVDTAAPDRLVLVLVHRPTLSAGALDARARTVRVQWSHPRPLAASRAWQLAPGAAPAWAALAAPAVGGGAVTLTLPALSVTTLELTP